MAEIKKVYLKNGRTRYRFVVDTGRAPESGKRLQKTFTFDTLKEARAERARITAETAQGTYVRPSKLTLDEYLNQWLPPVVRDLTENTKRNYEDALRPARQRLGHKALQDISKDDVEKLIEWMLTSGRRRGGKPGTGLSGRSVNLTLDRLTAALETAHAEGKIVRNPATLVKHVKHEPTKRGVWSKEEVQKFLAIATKERLHAAWRLSLYGLRRGEVLGLEWPLVDWGSFAEQCRTHREKWCVQCYSKGKNYRPTTISIEKTRVLVEYRLVVKPPKSKNGLRTLPLDAETAAALRALWVRQAAEKLEAGPAYATADTSYLWEGERVADAETGWVVVDELGEPVHPEWYSDEWERVRKRAGVSKIVLHGARHTALSLMEKAKVPISIISKWAGHYDVKFTYTQYVHAQDEDLHEGSTALGELFKAN
ncbi:tyrosine-type recombinase/integrase [Saccharomonospora sp. NPDC046836]|uniref:tyrosine-type recombinase/integrase n=1 Tax=Saccharomonospora sp. NPDC046836 TaxID=3156921 RepID=UPI003404297E